MEDLQDLMLQAQEKLRDQKENNIIGENNEDIYAQLREEVGEDEDYENTSYPDPKINYQEPVYTEKEIDIKYNKNEDEISDYKIQGNNNSIFPGGPTVAQVDIWKKQFTNEKVFHVQVLEKDFIFRTLNRYEYKQIVAIENTDSLFREEVICRTCVLFPYNYDFKTMAKEDSGYPSTLASIIMENSGFTTNYGIEVL